MTTTTRVASTSCSRGSDDEPAVRKGPWTLEEDLILASYICQHGEGSWDNLACAAGKASLDRDPCIHPPISFLCMHAFIHHEHNDLKLFICKWAQLNSL